MKPLNRLSSNWNRQTRNEVNENWDIIEDNLGGSGKQSAEALTKANEALSKANKAETDSTEAKNTAESVQTQLDGIVIESGTSDAEVIQARGGKPTLRARLDEKEEEFSTQLAQTAQITRHPIVQGLLDKPITVGHRGLWAVYPENTIVAFQQCLKNGVRYIETDFQKTSDGYWVCLHDETTGRTSSVNKTIATSTLAEIMAISQDKTTNAFLYDNPPIPTIEEVFSFIKKTGAIININFEYGLLQSDVPILINKIYEAGVQDNVIVQYEHFGAFTDKICMSVNGVPLTDEAFAELSKKGNLIAAYGYGYVANTTAVNNTLVYCRKYNVPMIIYNTTNYEVFKTLDKTGVHAMMVDNLWLRGANQNVV